VVRHASKAHPYAFAGSDPINGTDPTGLDEELGSMGDFFLDYSTMEKHEETGQIDVVSASGRYTYHWIPELNTWMRFESEVIVVEGEAPPSVDVVVVPELDGYGTAVAESMEGELSGFESTKEMVDAIFESIGDNNIRSLTIHNHAGVGYQHLYMARSERLDVDRTSDEAMREFARLKPRLVGPVTLGGCDVAAGIEGAKLLQQMADGWGVPFIGSTGQTRAWAGMHDGILVTRHPGQSFDPVDILVEQIEGELAVEKPNAFYTKTPTELVLARLNEAAREDKLELVLMRLMMSGSYGKLQDRLNGEQPKASLARRINNLGIPGIRAWHGSE
ncbi:MAG TPA: hypothetical protein VM686_31580, partial [Polyangiaceae bacterium]|nr:hypothetical protein [Polyangiaceae bacterium]